MVNRIISFYHLSEYTQSQERPQLKQKAPTMQLSFLPLAGLGYLAASVYAKDFYILQANLQVRPLFLPRTAISHIAHAKKPQLTSSQNCIGVGIVVGVCTNTAQQGIVPVDSFNCDSLNDYLTDGPSPPSCNNDPDDDEHSAQGCVFQGTDGGFVLSKDDGVEFYDFFIKGVDGIDDELVVATCVAPSTCKAGDANSGVLFDSAQCFGNTEVDAIFKCTDFPGAGVVTCP